MPSIASSMDGNVGPSRKPSNSCLYAPIAASRRDTVSGLYLCLPLSKCLSNPHWLWYVLVHPASGQGNISLLIELTASSSSSRSPSSCVSLQLVSSEDRPRTIIGSRIGFQYLSVEILASSFPS